MGKCTNAVWTGKGKKQNNKKLADVLVFNTWMRETVCIRVWLLFHSKTSEATEETITSINWLTGRAARSLSVTCGRRSLIGRRSQTRGSSAGRKNKNTKATKKKKKNVNRNVVAKTKNRLNLQESQLKLNCESGITLYIKKKRKKKKKKTISLYLLSLFSPSVLIYDLVWEIRFVAGVLFFQFM